jgi:hypothetical protein
LHLKRDLKIEKNFLFSYLLWAKTQLTLEPAQPSPAYPFLVHSPAHVLASNPVVAQLP